MVLQCCSKMRCVVSYPRPSVCGAQTVAFPTYPGPQHTTQSACCVLEDTGLSYCTVCISHLGNSMPDRQALMEIVAGLDTLEACSAARGAGVALSATLTPMRSTVVRRMLYYALGVPGILVIAAIPINTLCRASIVPASALLPSSRMVLCMTQTCKMDL